MRICLTGTLNLSSWHDQDRGQTDINAPLGCLSLAAVLRQKGHEVSLIDWNHEVALGRIPLSEHLYERAAERIADTRPDIVGFSTMCNSYHMTLRMAEAWKQHDATVPVILGGPQASVVDRETLEAFAFVDYILRGEAEQTLPQFLAELSAGATGFTTPGLTYRSSSGIVRNPDTALLPDLDVLPLPAYDLLPYSPGDSGAIDAGRGCPFECTFCSTATYWRRRFRLKSIDRILLEMKTLHDDYGAAGVTLQHDLFTVNHQRVEEFCSRLIDEGATMKWGCSARVDCVTPALLRRMAEAGCCGIFFGVETGSPRMQKEIRKRLKVEQVRVAVDAALDAGIIPTVSFIAGHPAETEDDLALTAAMIETLLDRPQVHVQGHLLGPEPGTHDYVTYRDRLRFDGYYSDIAGTAYQLLDREWFERFPELFSSFYYYEPLSMSRELLKGFDLFIHGPCAVLRKQVLQLAASRGGLWPLYREWKAWSGERGLGLGPIAGQRVDEFLLDFYQFLEAAAEDGAPVDTGAARDEILSFYFRHYGETPVRFVPSQAEPVEVGAI